MFIQNQNVNIQKFHSDEFGGLDILIINAKPYFPATECAKILGYSKPHSAIERHCRYSLKQGVPHPQSPGKIIEVNFIPEGDLYRLIIRSKLPASERFEAWVFDTVLPSIRKYGAYISPETLEEMVQSPEFVATLLEELKKEQAKIAEMAPKASYYNKILQCKQAIPVSLIAKDYGFSAARFNKILHNYGIQYKISGCWLLYQEHAGKGYTKTRTYYYSENKATMHTCWTQKGRLFLYKFLRECGIEPVACFTDDDYYEEDSSQVHLDDSRVGA